LVGVSNIGVDRSEREGRGPEEIDGGFVSSGEWRVPRSSAECAQLSFEILRRSPLPSECNADSELSVVRAEGELRSRTDLRKVSVVIGQMKRGQGCEWLTSTVTVALDMEHYRALVVVAKEGSIGGPAESGLTWK
jgi:hypothetical protein